jgi:hypothetical protein
VTLTLNDTVQQDEWRLVCSTLAQLFATPPTCQRATLMQLKLSGTATDFLANYDSTLNAEGLDLTVEHRACPALCAVVGTVSRLRLVETQLECRFPPITAIRCSADVLDASRVCTQFLHRALRASLASKVRIGHLFLPSRVGTSTIYVLDYELLAHVEAVHLNIKLCDLEPWTVVRILRNSTVRVYIHTYGCSNIVVKKSIVNFRFAKLTEALLSYSNAHPLDFQVLCRRAQFVLHQGDTAPYEGIRAIAYRELEHLLGVTPLPYRNI